jgi:hypothetical protein
VRNRLQPQNLIRDHQDQLILNSKSACCDGNATVSLFPVTLKTVKQTEMLSLQKNKTRNSIAQISIEPAFQSPKMHNYSNYEGGNVTQSNPGKCSGLGVRQNKSTIGSTTRNANKKSQLNSKSSSGIPDYSNRISNEFHSGRGFFPIDKNLGRPEKSMGNQVDLKANDYNLQIAANNPLLNSSKGQQFCENRMPFLNGNSSLVAERVIYRQLAHSVIRTNRPERRKVNYEKRNANQCSSIGREQDCHC